MSARQRAVDVCLAYLRDAGREKERQTQPGTEAESTEARRSRRGGWGESDRSEAGTREPGHGCLSPTAGTGAQAGAAADGS